MRVRYTNVELETRKRAQAVLDNPASDDWHRKRAMGDLKRTQATAESRAQQRDTQSAQPQRDIPPNGTSPAAWKEECQRVEKFFEAVREGRVTKREAQAPTQHTTPTQPETENTSVEPRAVPNTEVCPLCLIAKSLCGHAVQMVGG